MVGARLALLPEGALGDLGVVVDVGANIGDWSAAVLLLTEPRRVIMLEPDTRLTDALRDRFSGVDAVEVHCVAAGPETATASLALTEVTLSSSLLERRPEMEERYGRGYLPIGTMEVPVVPLDEVTAEVEAISLLKIDVQGSELAVLGGAEQTLRKTNFVIIEANLYSHYVGDATFADIHEAMGQRQFELANLSPPCLVGGRAMWFDALYRRLPEA
jgi:FkbM family methyltransferase